MSINGVFRAAIVATGAALLLACQSRPDAAAGRNAPQGASGAGIVSLDNGRVTLTAAAAAVSVVPEPPAAPKLPPILNVPRARQLIVPSSEFDVNVWGGAVNTHTLLDAAGKGAVPVSEARFLWGQGQLYVSFYAGDLDLEVRQTKHDSPVWMDDSLNLAFVLPDGSARMLSVSPTGVMADGTCPPGVAELADTRCDLHWESHARVGFDYDGTLNKLGDFDEEWNLQLAIPLSVLQAQAGGHPMLKFAIRRCDMAFDGQRACGRWGTLDEPAQLRLE